MGQSSNLHPEPSDGLFPTNPIDVFRRCHYRVSHQLGPYRTRINPSDDPHSFDPAKDLVFYAFMGIPELLQEKLFEIRAVLQERGKSLKSMWQYWMATQTETPQQLGDTCYSVALQR